MEKLAIDGGAPVRSKAPIVETDYFTDDELNAVINVMKSARIRRGVVTDEYEKLIAETLNVKHAIAVTSGTTTLHIALAAMGIGPGDEVIVTPYTFIASDTCVLEQNAIPIFADVDPVTLTLDPNDVRKKVTKRTKAIIPVSIAGIPINIEPIMDIAKEHNLFVLEDSAQSIGAKYHGRYEGKYVGTVGHVGSFSTVTGKIISTGEGGFVVTDDDDLYEKMWGFMDFGRKKSQGPASKYHWSLPCTNYRITDFQSAVGIQQLKRLDYINQKRNSNAHYLNEKLKDLPGITLPPEVPYGDRVFFYYVIRVNPDVLGTDMLNFAIALAAEGTYNLNYLSTTRWMVPQHLEPLFVNKAGYGGTKCPFECPWYEGEVSYHEGLCPVAEKACEEVFWLASVHPLLEKQDLDDIANAVRKVVLNFIEKKEKGMSIDYTTDEIRARL